MVGGAGEPRAHRLGDDVELGIDGLSGVEVIGGGGSSTVHRARQEALDRVVAVKVIHGSWSLDTRERFDHERAVMGRLSGHSAVVPILETGITRRGEPYLLMPFYERGSLFRLLKARGPLPWPEAVHLIEPVAGALADCHRDGVVHRDVKPANILLSRHLHPRLADFGIALPAGEPIPAAGVAYTPSYSPPEAHDPGTADPTVDVYGLGATLWALLAGHAPHTPPDRPASDSPNRAAADPAASGRRVDPAEIVERARLGPLDRPHPDCPDPLADLLARATDPDPARRPIDGAAFLAELRRAVRLGEGAAPEVGSRRPRWGRAASPVVVLSALIVIGAILTLVGALALAG